MYKTADCRGVIAPLWKLRLMRAGSAWDCLLSCMEAGQGWLRAAEPISLKQRAHHIFFVKKDEKGALMPKVPEIFL